MNYAIRLHHTGGPEVLFWKQVPVPTPGPGEVLLRQTAIGLNFIDVYHRNGLYPLGDLPATPGLEAAAVVDAVGDGVVSVAPGQRVAYASLPPGAYAEVRVMPAARVVPLPDTIDDRTAAAMMLKGMTARYLLKRTYSVEAGDVILVHAAAGGVGLILCQWAKHLGATVIGTVGSPAKAELARAHGCDHTILYSQETVPERVREITDGRGVAVVYDSVGKATFAGSIDSLAPLGMMVSYGNASGPLDPVDPALLAKKGSLFFTRPSLMTYTASDADYIETARDLIGAVTSGAVRIRVNQTYALRDAAQAHRDLEARRTTGSVVLLPD